MSSIWLSIKDYPNYKVSPEGNILSLNFNGTKKPKILIFGDSRGYRNITLYNSKGKKTFKVHRLVAEIFNENEKNKKEVNHIDGNKLNNNYNNLEWCTRKENAKHVFEVLNYKSVFGEKHGISKLTNKCVLEIDNLIKQNIKYKIIADKFNISKATITNIKKGLVWSHVTGRNKHVA